MTRVIIGLVLLVYGVSELLIITEGYDTLWEALVLKLNLIIRRADSINIYNI